MSIQLYNTLTRRKERFEPADPERVTMYVCGPTVYSYPHIGNARPAVVFDLLYRLLVSEYPRVEYARNITDVDDKINAAALAEGVAIDVVTRRYTDAYHEDMTALGVLGPTAEPRATDHIDAMVAMIEGLIASDHAYPAEGHVLFHVPSFEDYGRLSGRNRDDMIAGARVEVAPYKRDPADFVLWKPSAAEQPGWDSPWGRGRPGWHLECSCMVAEHLGPTIDIHGGGSDLVFPHHENEIAQSRCAFPGEAFSRFWLHNGFVNVDSEKMSKSIGNVLLVRNLLDEAPGEAIRMALLSAHYRKPLDWSSEGLAQAARGLDRLYRTLAELAPVAAADTGPSATVADALADDLNTPRALAGLFDLSHAANADRPGGDLSRTKGELLASGKLLGLLRHTPEEWFAARFGESTDADRVEQLVREREDARARRDYQRADSIRDDLLREGIVLEDGPDGTQWRKTG